MHFSNHGLAGAVGNGLLAVPTSLETMQNLPAWSSRCPPVRPYPALQSRSSMASCAGSDDGPQFLLVDHFRGPGSGVADQAGDLLGADALVAHQRHEPGPQLPGCPLLANPGRLAVCPQRPPYVAWVKWSAQAGREYQVVLVTESTRLEPLRPDAPGARAALPRPRPGAAGSGVSMATES